MIPTVRGANIYSSTQDTTVAEFSLSRFRLKINVVNKVYSEKKLIRFSLDPSRPNLVLKQAHLVFEIRGGFAGMNTLEFQKLIDFKNR